MAGLRRERGQERREIVAAAGGALGAGAILVGIASQHREPAPVSKLSEVTPFFAIY